MSHHPIGPDWAGLAWAALPLLAATILLAAMRLGQVGAVAVAVARLVGQMMLLAVVLGGIVRADSPALVLLVAVTMLAVAAHTVGTRQKSRGGRWAIRVEAFGSLLIGGTIAMAVAIRLSLHVEPWYDARTVLPMVGMILGNTVSALGLAAERFAADLRADRDLVEQRLCLGATGWQAATPALRAAVAAGLTPILNNMMLAGIVAIPGMTTGQLLAGADVGLAVRYQILIYFAAGATIISAVLILLAIRFRRAFTADHQLRRDFLDG